MKTVTVNLKTFTTSYFDDDQNSACWGEADLKQALTDLLSKDDAIAARGLAWLRQNVRSFAQLP